MKQLISSLILLVLLTLSDTSEAQQSQDFGDYVVHYNALNTNFIPPQVAKGYGIHRSSSRALLNITVLKKVMDTPGTAVKANVTASGTNLTGQRREIDIREIKEAEGAIYRYINPPVMGPDAMLPKINTLPGTKRQTAFPDGDGQFATGKNGTDMGGHVIRTFHAVGVARVTIRHKPVDEAFQIPTDVRIGILGNQQGCAGVTEKYMTQPNGNTALHDYVL